MDKEKMAQGIGVIFLVVVIGLTLLNLGILQACKAVQAQVDRNPMALNLGQAKGVSIMLVKLGQTPDKQSGIYALQIPEAGAPAPVATPAAAVPPVAPAMPPPDSVPFPAPAEVPAPLTPAAAPTP